MGDVLAVYALGSKGVNVVDDPLVLDEAALQNAQNAQTSPVEGEQSLLKRAGLGRLATVGGAAVLSIIGVPFADLTPGSLVEPSYPPMANPAVLHWREFLTWRKVDVENTLTVAVHSAAFAGAPAVAPILSAAPGAGFFAPPWQMDFDVQITATAGADLETSILIVGDVPDVDLFTMGVGFELRAMSYSGACALSLMVAPSYNSDFMTPVTAGVPLYLRLSLAATWDGGAGVWHTTWTVTRYTTAARTSAAATKAVTQDMTAAEMTSLQYARVLEWLWIAGPLPVSIANLTVPEAP